MSKHAHVTDLEAAQQRAFKKAKTLQVESVVDWKHQTWYDIPFLQFPIDLRSSQGRQFRKQCGHIQNTTHLKKFTKLLAQIAQQQEKQKHVNICTHLQKIPQATIRTLQKAVRKWWTIRCIEQKGVGFYTPLLWKNQVDPVSLEKLCDLSPVLLFTYRDSQRSVYAFDIRTLWKLVKNKMLTNPFTNEPLPAGVIQRLHLRVEILQKLGYSLCIEDESENASKKKRTLQQKNDANILTISQALDSKGFHTTIEMFTSLNEAQLVKWYRRCEDIWNYRAELTDVDRAKIAPDGNVFPFKASIQSYTNRKNKLIGHITEAMLKLTTTGITDSEQTTGSMYVISALTECCHVFQTSFPHLYQPP